jgi:hypothetical protein
MAVASADPFIDVVPKWGFGSHKVFSSSRSFGH